MNNYQEQLKKEYQQMADAFGIGTSGWNMLYTKFNSSVFCDDNKASIIGQYLTWYDFTKCSEKMTSFTIMVLMNFSKSIKMQFSLA